MNHRDKARRARPKKKKNTRSRRKNHDKFDSTCGYPGEGHAAAVKRAVKPKAAWKRFQPTVPADAPDCPKTTCKRHYHTRGPYEGAQRRIEEKGGGDGGGGGGDEPKPPRELVLCDVPLVKDCDKKFHFHPSNNQGRAIVKGDGAVHLGKLRGDAKAVVGQLAAIEDTKGVLATFVKAGPCNESNRPRQPPAINNLRVEPAQPARNGDAKYGQLPGRVPTDDADALNQFDGFGNMFEERPYQPAAYQPRPVERPAIEVRYVQAQVPVAQNLAQPAPVPEAPLRVADRILQFEPPVVVLDAEAHRRNLDEAQLATILGIEERIIFTTGEGEREWACCASIRDTCFWLCSWIEPGQRTSMSNSLVTLVR